MKKPSLWHATTLALLSLVTATAQAGITTRVSVDSAGVQGNDDSGAYSKCSLSADGRYIAYSSEASNLVTGDTNNIDDVFVYDRTTGSTTRISVNSAGNQANHGSGDACLSTDGRYVAFQSYASNLVPDDTNFGDIFVHDRHTGNTSRVSVSSSGGQVDATSYSPSLSADGRYVAFYSWASTLVPDDTNRYSDVFVHDRTTGATTRASVTSAGMQGNGSSFGMSLSADGRYIAFDSNASNLVPSDTNDSSDVFVHDNLTGLTSRVSVNSAGGQSNNYSNEPSISADGRYVAFQSGASNLAPGDTNDTADAFVHDRVTGFTTRVSVNSAGGQSNGFSNFPSLSADGRYIAFSSVASNLVPGDTNNTTDNFVHDRATGSTTRVSVNRAGGQVSSGSLFSFALSADGRYASFTSFASNVVPGDTNHAYDVFVHDRLGTLLEGPAGAASCTDDLDNDNDSKIDAADIDCEPILEPLYCNAQLVTIRGTPGSDILTGTTGKDVISGLAGNDVINGAGGNDVICGGDGNDTLSGDGGQDRLFGGPGDDALNGGNGADRMNGGPGTDRCDGHAGTDTHLGGCETLTNTP